MDIQPKDTSRGHFYVSIAKSSLRMAGCIGSLINGTVTPLAVAFLFAEVLGVIEEMV